MLGRFHLVYQGQVVSTVCTSRLQTLLSYLVLNAGAVQSREYLSFLLWPDSSESQARTNLRQLLHHLRAALPEPESFLETGTQTLRWRSNADFSLDVREFETAVSRANEAEKVGNPIAEREMLERAAEMYRGDLLPGLYDEWIEGERRRLSEKHIEVLNRLVSLLEQKRDFLLAIQYAERLMRLEPLREASYQHLMHLHALNGDRAGALRVYQQCINALQQELNIEPGPATRQMHEQVMNLDAVPVEKPLQSCPPVYSELPLIGRQNELDRLLDLWQSAIEGQAAFVLLLGEPGIGKTRLTEELVTRVEQWNASTAYARCYEAEGHFPYAPVTRWLRSKPVLRGLFELSSVQLSELVRVLPELLSEHPELSTPQPFAESWQRRHFFEAMAHAVLKVRPPLLLIIDDLQWCDRDTIDWLHFLLRFAAKAPLLIVGSARQEELGNTHPVTALLRQLFRDDLASEIVLSRLNSDQTATLAAGVSSQKLDATSLEYIFRETEGNPLFVIESVRAGLTTSRESPVGCAEQNPGPVGLDGVLPPKVHAVLSARLAQLSAPARELVGIAASIGRSFTLELLVKTSQRSEESLVPVLDELWERQVVQHREDGSYDFSHDKLREVAYAEVGPARQRLLHRWAAEALETISASDLDAVSSRLARHYEQAGMQARAIPYYHRAAKSSQRVYAYVEAIGFLKRALELLEALPQTKERDLLELDLLISLGPSLNVIRGYAASEVGRIYSRARLLCEFAEARDRYFPVLWGSWVFHVVRADLQAAKELASRLLQLAQNQENPTIVAAGHFTLGCTLFHFGELKQAREHFEEALERYDPQAYPFVLQVYGPELGVFCLSYLAHVLWLLGFPDQALERSASALARAQELAHPFSVVVALDYLALLHQFRGDRAGATGRAEEAAALCDEYGFRYYLAWTPIIRGWARIQADSAEAGAREIRQGLDALREVEARLRKPYYYTLLAQACDNIGQTDEGLKQVADAFAAIEESKESWGESELHRTKGNLLLHRGEARDAELSYQRALSVARQQEAKTFELRAALCLCRLWAEQRKHGQAVTLLRKTCNKFTEGASNLDLQDANSFLDRLSRRTKVL